MSEDKEKTAPLRNRVDLHCHTFYSDGRYSPAEVIEAALEYNLRTLAITDHDNTRGARAAMRLAQEAGLELISGVEFTTRWPGGNLPSSDVNVDVLGYFIDLRNAEFLAFEQAALNDIHERIRVCCERLSAKGVPISMADVLLENPRYAGGIQLVHALLNRKLAHSWGEAMRLFEQGWQPGRESAFTLRSVIEQIHLAGGVAVLAHPSIVRPGGQRLEAQHMAQLADWGLDGVEIYHHRLDEAAREHFLQLAQQFGLLVTGGSDMHGWGRGIHDLGKQPVTSEMVEALRERASQYA